MSCFNDLNEMELYNIEGGVIEWVPLIKGAAVVAGVGVGGVVVGAACVAGGYYLCKWAFGWFEAS